MQKAVKGKHLGGLTSGGLGTPPERHVANSRCSYRSMNYITNLRSYLPKPISGLRNDVFFDDHESVRTSCQSDQDD